MLTVFCDADFCGIRVEPQAVDSASIYCCNALLVSMTRESLRPYFWGSAYIVQGQVHGQATMGRKNISARLSPLGGSAQLAQSHHHVHLLLSSTRLGTTSSIAHGDQPSQYVACGPGSHLRTMCVHLMFTDAHDTTNDAINSNMNRRRIFHIVTSACAAHAEPDFAEREYDAHGKLGRDADAAVDNARRSLRMLL